MPNNITPKTLSITSKMQSPKLTRSNSFTSLDQLKVKQVQEKITQQYESPKKPKQNSLRIAVLKKNYRKRLVEEINEKQKQKFSNFWGIDQIVEEKAGENSKKVENKPEEQTSEPSKNSGKLNGARCLIKPTKLITLKTKKASVTPDDVKKPQPIPLSRSKSFSGTTKPVVEIRKPKLVSLDLKVPKPSIEGEKPGFCISKPTFFRKPVILSKLMPPTPTKQKRQPEPQARSTLGFSARSLFQQNGKPQKIAKKSENSSNFCLSSEAALSHKEKIIEMNEKMKYVRQLEKDFNESKMKRQKVDDEEKEKKSKKRLSFGKNPLHFLVGARNKEGGEN